ncbi:dual specificity protein phosphatase CDC14C-like isoform X2 [Panonychus citri]|uniref:dual specificity protein phosphatase CDC14C-like isoform X2 n=1 Tax=Panonychus citri TaxID=50023 RepID=UPI0023082C61|nr:dual specificity protein phosphatase CDC14C-like isoform X2 [Panonychus citri]
MSFLEDIVNNFNRYKLTADEKLKIPGLLQLTSIVSDRLYFATVTNGFPHFNQDSLPYIAVSNDEFQYKGFDRDFGPFNLAVVYLFCEKMSRIMDSSPSKPIIHYTYGSDEDRVNSAFLIGCYAIIKLGIDCNQVMIKLRKNSPARYRTYRDASYSSCDFGLPLPDCLKAIQKAIKSKIYEYSKFDLAEYLFYEEVRNGDLNWIIPGKLIAFCGPTEGGLLLLSNVFSYSRLPPEYYFSYFTKNGVTTVVRLNSPVYSGKIFSEVGIRHIDLYFDDGTTPDLSIVDKFLEVCEGTSGVVAVHCKAGLGRTGTLIACYLMKHYKFTAAEAIAWIRICRPGSIIGPQQQWLVTMQPRLWLAGSAIHDSKREKSKKNVTNGGDTIINEKEKDKKSDSLSKITCEFKRIEIRDGANKSKSSEKLTTSTKSTNSKDSIKSDQSIKLKSGRPDTRSNRQPNSLSTSSSTSSSSTTSALSSNNNNNNNNNDNNNDESMNNSNTETQGDRLNRLKLNRSASQPNERIIPIKIETRAESAMKHNNNNNNNNNNNINESIIIIKNDHRHNTNDKISKNNNSIENKYSSLNNNISGQHHHYNTRSCGRSNGTSKLTLSSSESASSSPAIRKSSRTSKGNNQTSASTQKSSVIITSTSHGQTNKSTSTKRR